MKKNKVETISPSKCISSLEEFNSRVLNLSMLVSTVTTTFGDKMDEKVKNMLVSANNEVKEFYI